MSNENNIQALAESLWSYFEPKIDAKLGNSVSYYRATVKSAASGGKIGIQKPFDDAIIYLPYASSVSSAAVGSQVTVLCLGSQSNAVIIGNGMLNNL